MAKKSASKKDPREEVTIKVGTTVAGKWREPGDTVKVYDFEKRWLIWSGYVEGTYKDAASEAEIAQGNFDEPEVEEVYNPDAFAPEDQRPSESEAESIITPEQAAQQENK